MRQLNISKPPAVLTIDIIFTWQSKIAKTDCFCRLRIYKITFDKAVVIVSELPENPGRSIIGEELTLIPLVCHKFALNPTKTMLLEHYPKGYLKDLDRDPRGYFKEEETYEQVILVQDNVCSKRIKKEQIEALLGIRLD